MPAWNELSISSLDEINAVKDKLSNVLAVLQIAEKVAETVLAFVKAFLADLVNPIRAVMLLLLATIRSIINSLLSSGISALWILPDFSLPISGLINSVSGGFTSFEQKVLFKLNDTSDLNRPDYSDISGAAAVILYLGADNALQLINTISSFIQFFQGSGISLNLPSPINVKVSNVAQSDSTLSTITNFVNTLPNVFSRPLDNKLVIEWEMEVGPSGVDAPGFLNPLISFVPTVLWKSFIIERTTIPGDKSINVPIESATSGALTDTVTDRFGVYSLPSNLALRYPDGQSIYQFYETKFVVEDASSGFLPGFLATKFTYIDEDVEPGVVYYYRIMAYSGDVASYASAERPSFETPGTFVKVVDNTPILNLNQLVLGVPSEIVSGTVSTALKDKDWSPYDDLFDTLMTAILLNFEYTPVAAGEILSGPNLPGSIQSNQNLIDSQAGWGSCSAIAALVLNYKSFIDNSADFAKSTASRAVIRKIVNKILANVYDNKGLLDNLYNQWLVNRGLVRKIIPGGENASRLDYYLPNLVWTFPRVDVGDFISGPNAVSATQIILYLDASNQSPVNRLTLDSGLGSTSGKYKIESPCPISAISVAERNSLANMCRTMLLTLNSNVSNLAWKSITLGDFIPSLTFFLYDLEQFVLNIIKAMDSIGSDIIEMIQNIIFRIQQLQTIVRTITAIIDLFNIKLSVGVLLIAEPKGGVNALVEAIQSAEDKPEPNAQGLHSGLVLTAGGPGAGAIEAISGLLNAFGLGGG